MFLDNAAFANNMTCLILFIDNRRAQIEFLRTIQELDASELPGLIQKEPSENYLKKLASMRNNLRHILQYGNVIPFSWYTKGYRCFYCQKAMKDCDVLREHTLTKHQGIDLDIFIPQRIISKDFPIKVDVTDLQCKVCSVQLANLTELIEHILAVHGEDYNITTGDCFLPFILTKNSMTCCICAAQLDNITCMVTHMHKAHMLHKYLCQTCGLSFIDKVRLKRHISKSHVGHICTVCQKVFDAFHKLEKHKQRIHGIVKKHECSLCSATFDNNYQVKVHMGKVHKVEKYQIKCEHCPKVTTTKGAMLLHVQSLHSDVKYSCDLCSYQCGIKWMIKLHKRRHFGDKEYCCTICQRKFGRSSNLRAHMKIHTGNIGRVCRWCKQGFTDNESLHTHEMDTHYYSEYA